MHNKKVCFVIQRYGEEVNGGAEQHCRFLAERMAKFCNVEVLTTKAKDYMTWKNEYKEDIEWLNDVKIRRFGVVAERNIDTFSNVSMSIRNNYSGDEELQEAVENMWIDEQGPLVPDLVEYIKNHKDDYDVFIFFTYLYYPTVKGLPEVADKSILLPLAHDEYELYIGAFKKLFRLPRAFFFNTTEERDLVRHVFKNYGIPYKIGGVGVDLPEHIDVEGFKKKYNLDKYIIYVGRICESKNVNQLLDYFEQYKEEQGDSSKDLKLVLVGKTEINVEGREDVISLGFVDEADKYAAIAGAVALIQPSKFESLSMVVLESFKLSRPVIVNGECKVLKGHIDKSEGGYAYESYEEFKNALYNLEHDAIKNRNMGNNGLRYVNANYDWDDICNKLMYIINTISH